jgi:hypothetical protein
MLQPPDAQGRYHVGLGEIVRILPKSGSNATSAEGIVVGFDDSGCWVLTPQQSFVDPNVRVEWVHVGQLIRWAAPETIVRTYSGHQQADANTKFVAEAERLGAAGYAPSTQSWAAGQYGCGSFLIAVLLMIVLVGFLVFIYMLVVKPDGTLTVTYQRKAHAPAAAAPAAPKGESTADRLRRLDEARSSGVITEDEYNAARARIVGEF